jgi:uncharacterized membrane protein YcgQ (UPF0703/DUF1980 family)
MENYERKGVSVYLFTGFLGGGKTTFIQSCLENIRFCTGEPTLLLVCEEGEEEYDPKRFANTGVTIRYIEGLENLKEETLERFRKEAGDEAGEVRRVLVEYNGMWMIEELEKAMPSHWKIFREMTFLDGPTFLLYNTNMRQLMVDKLKKSMVVALNHTNDQMDKERIHTIIRAASLHIDIAYQYDDGRLEPDTIVDRDPVDLNQPVVDVTDSVYAWWARDLTEEPEKYVGKTVCVHARIMPRHDTEAGELCFGRYVMVCCENDIQFVGFICDHVSGELPDSPWIRLTAKIHMDFHPAYGRSGPMFTCLDLQSAEKPDQEVATFYS